MAKTYCKNESDSNDRRYSVILTHEQLRSLIEWIPKNYDSEPHEEGGVLMAILEDAEEIV